MAHSNLARPGGKILDAIAIAALLAAAVAFRTASLDRSLWLDEAWVANSASSETLNEVFSYRGNLQISPPLFLVTVRGSMEAMGRSHAAVRSAPFLLGVGARVWLWFLARTALPRRWAILAWSLIALSPTAAVYSQTLKQYSGEMAAALAALLACVRYLARPDRWRFGVLAGVTVAAMALAYSTVFLAPAVVCVVFMGKPRRAALLGASAVAMGGLLYVTLIAPNTSPALKDFWEAAGGGAWFNNPAVAPVVVWLRQLPLPERLLDRSSLFGAVVMAGVLAVSGVWGLAVGFGRWLKGRPRLARLQILFGGPCLAFAVANALGVYPLSARTALFALPCFALLAVVNLRVAALTALRGRRAIVERAALAAAAAVLLMGAERNTLRLVPEEDAEGAIAHLRRNVEAGDLVWVHASCAETFRFYGGGIEGGGVKVKHGGTGWACCPRGLPSSKGRSTEAAVRAEVAAAAPFPKAVWVLSTERGSHWEFVGLDEPQAMKAALGEAGCRERATSRFEGMSVARFECEGLGGGGDRAVFRGFAERAGRGAPPNYIEPKLFPNPPQLEHFPTP